MKILFLDQTGKLGGAELVLLDTAKSYQGTCLVGLFEDGPFRSLVEQQQIQVQVLATQPLEVRKDSSFIQGLGSLGQLLPLIAKVVQLSRNYDLIYANTQKALVVGALASFFSNRPLVFHLHDILSEEHFSRANRHLCVALANRFASRVIAVSKAAQTAFVAAGGRPDLVKVVYNGYEPERYQNQEQNPAQVRQQLGLNGQFVVAHFSRLSPWKGQHILIEAITQCPEDVIAVLVGDALFGEQDYVEQLHQQVARLGLKNRVRFLGFRSDVPQLMAACDLVAHTSILAEPATRVIIEAMLCGKPLVGVQAGGTVEFVESGETGWLVEPGNPQQLAEIINTCRNQPEYAAAIAKQSQIQASQRFNLTVTNQQIAQLLDQVVKLRTHLKTTQ